MTGIMATLAHADRYSRYYGWTDACVRVILRAAQNHKPVSLWLTVFPIFPISPISHSPRLRLFGIYATRSTFRLLTPQEPLADREFSSQQLPTCGYLAAP